MGSFFAGVKAGTLSATAYVGGMAAFNALLLYASKAEVLSIIEKSYPSICSAAVDYNSTSAAVQNCFSSVVAVYVPLVAFLGFFVAMVYAGIFGRFYEIFPGRSPISKGVTMAVVVGISLLLLNLVGIDFDFEAKIVTTTFFIFWTFLYGVMIGKLYKRYTREVRFVSRDEASLRILVDSRDCTGKTKTFALRSSHELLARAGEGGSFKEWSVSGGVTVEDSRSFETTMEVEGDGALIAQSAPKTLGR